MKHLLMHPHFPDIVGAWAAEQVEGRELPCANDNEANVDLSEINDPLLAALARLEVCADRVW